MVTIKGFNLTNMAYFVCATGSDYTAPNGQRGHDSSGGDIAHGASEFYDAAEHGVPTGSTMNLYIVVHGGNDRTGGEQFVLDPTSKSEANYTITGSTYDSSVQFNGVTEKA